ncbi:MAG: hypothetical protein V7761_08695, partial [Amylibacter sp.]
NTDDSFTSGSNFATAFGGGATINVTNVAAATQFDLDLDNLTVVTTLALTTGNVGATAVDDHIISTGSAADSVTVTAAAYAGTAGTSAGSDITVTTNAGNDTVVVTTDVYTGHATADGGSIAIATGAGDDTITFGYATLLAQTTSQTVTITGGTGADTITKGGGGANANGTAGLAYTLFEVAEGDSTSTAFDNITGFDVAAAGADLSDQLNFGSATQATIGTLGTETDSGTILSHTITDGVVGFDDAATYNATIIINSANLADAIAYLATNSTDNETFAFIYDSTNNGAADATMVYHNGVVTDSVVQLLATNTVDALITTNGTGGNDLFIA